jgi:DNA-directed RNA polymerase specialized sigma24 family protein
MWRLTEDQKALAAEYYYIAEATAYKMRGRDHDRAMSASCYGLCYGIHKWIPGFGDKTLKNYLIWSCRKAIISDCRRENRQKWKMRVDGKHYPHMAMTNASDWDLEQWYEADKTQTDVTDNQRLKLSRVLPVLVPSELKIVKLVLKGMKPADITKMMRYRKNVVYAVVGKAVKRLKKELAR